MDNLELEPSMVSVIDGMNEELAVVQKECDKLKEEKEILKKQRTEYFHKYHLYSEFIPRLMKETGVDITMFFDPRMWRLIGGNMINQMIETYNEYERDFISREDTKKKVRDAFYTDLLHMTKCKGDNRLGNQLYVSHMTGWSIVNEDYLRDDYEQFCEGVAEADGEEQIGCREDDLQMIFEVLGGECNWFIFPLEDEDDNYLINDNN